MLYVSSVDACHMTVYILIRIYRSSQMWWLMPVLAALKADEKIASSSRPELPYPEKPDLDSLLYLITLQIIGLKSWV